MNFKIFLIFLITSNFIFGQSIQKSSFSFTSNANADYDLLFVSGQVDQGIINNTINLGFLPLNYSFLSINNTTKDQDFICYPNPFNQIIWIKIENWNQISGIRVFSINGAVVYQDNNPQQSSLKQLGI